jgi:hypothetical protein
MSEFSGAWSDGKFLRIECEIQGKLGNFSEFFPNFFRTNFQHFLECPNFQVKIKSNYPPPPYCQKPSL